MRVCSANQRLGRRLVLITTIYGLTAFGVGLAFAEHLVPKALDVPVALVPIVPAVFLPAAVVSIVRNLDELQQRIQFHAIAFAFQATGIASLSFGFLQIFAQVPTLSWVWVWPMLSLFWFVGMMIARRRYA